MDDVIYEWLSGRVNLGPTYWTFFVVFIKILLLFIVDEFVLFCETQNQVDIF